MKLNDFLDHPLVPMLVFLGVAFIVIGYVGIAIQLSHSQLPTPMDTFNAGFGFIGIALGLKAL
ncbi:hypothetical protein [Methanoregula sp.]|uniref:hypothetical protein n=1 Tax=Methanoregula sp. TaxID=2052170 RepID=UPI003BAE23D8